VSEFHKHGINIRKIDNETVSLSFDEMTTIYDLEEVIEILVSIKKRSFNTSKFLPAEIFESKLYSKVPIEIKR